MSLITPSINPTFTKDDYTKTSHSTNLTIPELELIEFDTILGLTNYHIFNNNKSLCTWIRNSPLGTIHVLTLLNPTGHSVSINSSNSVFILDTNNPLIKIIYTPNGYKKIID